MESLCSVLVCNLVIITIANTCDIRIENGRTIADCRDRGLRRVPSEELPHNTTDLLLDNNQIGYLEANAFVNLTSLEKLSVKFNGIQRLQEDSLVHLTQLEHLDLTFNDFWVNEETIPFHSFAFNSRMKVLILPEGTNDALPTALSTLQKLERLQVALHATGKESMSKLLLSSPSLIILNLSYGNISMLTTTFLEPLRETQVEELMIIDARVQHIESNLIKDFPSLHTVNIACNRLKGKAFMRMMKAFAVLGSTPLHTLILDGVNDNSLGYLSDETMCSDIQRVKRLSLKSNNIIGLNANALPCLQMEVLSMGSFNTLEILSPKSAFDNNLEQLTRDIPIHTLDLSYMFGSGPGFRSHFCHSKVPLANDDYLPRPIQSFPLVETIEILADQNYTGDLVPFPYNLRYLDVSHFGLTHSDTRHKYTMDPFIYNNSITIANFSFCNINLPFPAFYNAWKTQVLDLSYNGLSSIPMETRNSFYDHVNLRYLNISHNSLHDGKQDFADSFDYLRALISIDLSFNGLAFLANTTFATNLHLEEIILDYNQLTANINLLVSKNQNLRLLNLSHNQLAHLSQSFTDEIDILGHNLKLDITHNPFICNCDSINFIKWVNNTNVTLHKGNELECDFHNQSMPLSHFNSRMVQELEKSCRKANIRQLLSRALSGVLAPGLLVIGCLSLAYKFRWHLRWNYYSLRRKLAKNRHHALLNEEDGAVFDMYVVFHEEDTSFVYQELSPPLEDYGSSLYLSGRDDTPGMLQCDSIVYAMERSNRVVLCLTPAFSEDEMCEFALHMALVKGIRSVVVLIKDQPDLASLSSTLRALLQPNSGVPVLEWPEELSGQMLVTSHLRDFICCKEIEMKNVFEIN